MSDGGHWAAAPVVRIRPTGDVRVAGTSPASYDRSMIALALVAALAATPSTARLASDSVPARVTVTVADSLGHPVPGAVVRVDSTGWRTVSDAGTIELTGIAAGRHLLEARAIGYGVSAFHVRVDPGDVASIGMTLHRPAVVTLQDVMVQAARDTARLPIGVVHDWTEGFAHRKASNVGGIFIDHTQIERRGAYKMSQLLANQPGVQIVQMRNEFGEYNPYVIMRGTSTVNGEKCPISYFLDGHPYDLSQDESVDQIIQPHDVAAIEIYPGSSQVPAQFKTATSARCGVIVIWSRSAAP